MEIFSLFSLADFLAYLFPGFISLIGIYTILLLTPLKHQIYPPPVDFGSWLFVLIVSYLTGVLLAGMTDYLFRERSHLLRRKRLKGAIHIENDFLITEIKMAFHDLVLSNDRSSQNTPEAKDNSSINFDWSENHFYICRSIVYDSMPRSSVHSNREVAYRQLRMNLIASTCVWGVAGLLWGGLIIFGPAMVIGNSTDQVIIDRGWGWLLCLGAAVLTTLVISNLRFTMDRHEMREVREVLCAFLGGYKTGLIKKFKQPR